MRLIRNLAIIIAIMGMLSGCSAFTQETSNKIASPVNKAIPLMGKWVVEGFFAADDGSKLNAGDSRWIGKVFEFNDGSISFDGSNWEKVGFKIRRVNTEEYFLNKYDKAIARFGINSKEIQVITASSEDKYLYEFVRLGGAKILANIDNEFYYLGKADNGFSGSGANTQKAAYGSSAGNVFKDREQVNSGLLLGMRIPEQMNQKGTDVKLDRYIYKTYWISAVNSRIGSVLSAGNIFLPRKDGFWKLEVQQILGNEGLEDKLSATMVLNENVRNLPAQKEVSNKPLRMETKLRRTILYVGNDYICTENIEENRQAGASEAEQKRFFRTVPIDNIDTMEGIKFSDLTGENGSMAMDGAIADILDSTSNNSIRNVLEEGQEENFALFRKAGHWFFKGRLNLAPGEPMAYVDFNINLIPPADMVAYDILHVPWTRIKDRVPQAVDAYTSPNSELAVIITRNAALVYTIGKGGELSLEPVRKLAIPEGSMVVMAEWATGDYVKNWEKQFVKNNVVEQE